MRTLARGLLLFCFTATPALLHSTKEPVDTVRAIYAKDEIHCSRVYSKKLSQLLKQGEQKAEEQGGNANLDLALQLNEQDLAEGWEKTLRLEPVSREARRAEVKATFKNARTQELRYSLVLEKGHWVIDDVRSMGPEAWRLSQRLTEGK